MALVLTIFEILKKFKKRNKLVLLSVTNAILDLFTLATVFSLMVVFFRPAGMYADKVNYIYTQLNFKSQSSFIIFSTITLICFFVLKATFSLWINRVVATDIFKISEGISSRILKRYLMMSYLQFSRSDFSQELNRLVYLPFTFSDSLVVPALNILSEGLILISLLLGLAFFNINAFFFVLVLVSPLFLIYRTQKKKIASIDDGMRREYPMLIKQALHIIESLPEIKSFRKDSFFTYQYESTGKRLSRSFAMHHTLQNQSSRLSELIAAIGICLLILYAALSKQTVSGAFMLVGVYAGASFRITPSINKIFSALVQIRGHASVIDEFDKLDFTGKDATVSTITFNNSIELKNISFSYPGRSPVLKDLNLVIKKGEKIIITGRSGAGKSTLILLLLGLLRPTSGEVRIDHVHIDDENLDGLRSLIGYVQQNPVLLDASIAENIAFGVHPANIDFNRIAQLVSQLDLRSLLNQLPEGLQTTIGEKGVQLSGGQRQRIAIARALYHDPEIILLDEITSHLDSSTEQEVILTLKKLAMLKKTIVLISHQKNIIQHFDREMIMQDGQLQENTVQHQNT